MIRAKVWFKCAAMHDPVSPIIVKPCLIGWDAKKRKIDLVIERPFKGEELVLRMRGWITIDPAKFVEVVKRHGRLAILDDRDLVVETETVEDYERLLQELKSIFGDEVELEPIKRK